MLLLDSATGLATSNSVIKQIQLKKYFIILLILIGCSSTKTTTTDIIPSSKPIEYLDALDAKFDALDAKFDGRCVAITLKGERCKRNANIKDSLCWQHREIQDKKK